MKNIKELVKLLALGALTITISITTVSGGNITISLGDTANMVKPISYAFNEANMPQVEERLGDFIF